MKIKHVDRYHIVHNGCRLVELMPPDDATGTWCASYKWATSGRTMRESLKNLRERLNFVIKKIDEVMKDEDETSK